MIRTSPFRFAAAAAALALAVAAAAPTPGQARPGRSAEKLERAVEGLELDAATRESVFAVIDAARPTSRALRAQLGDAYRALHELLASPSPAQDAVFAQVDAASALRTELRKHELATALQVRELLGPEQEARLLEALGSHGGHHGRGCGRHARG